MSRRSFSFAGFGATALLAVLSLLPATASARAAHVVLLASGTAVQPGSPAYASARLGPCGTIIAGGTLTDNGHAKDNAAFDEGGSSGGGCGEAGPSFSGTIEGARTSNAGTITLLGEITYITAIPFCTYKLKKLVGTFSLPGSTEATVSGTGARIGSSKTGCAKHATVEGVEAKLGPTEGSAFEVVLE
jgi:hypothetical protein